MLNSITAGAVGGNQYQPKSSDSTTEEDASSQAATEESSASSTSADTSDDTKVAATSSSQEISQDPSADASNGNLADAIAASAEQSGPKSVKIETKADLREAAIVAQNQMRQDALFASITAPMEESSLVKLVSPAADRATAEAYETTSKLNEVAEPSSKLDRKL